jgi:hypothetical protein
MGKTVFTYNVETGEFFDAAPGGNGSEVCATSGGVIYTQYHKPKAAVIAGGFTPCDDATYTPPNAPSSIETYEATDGDSFTVHHLGKDPEPGDYTIVLTACTSDVPYETCTAENLSALAADLEAFKTGFRVELAGVDPVILAADHGRTDPIVTIYRGDEMVSFPIHVAPNDDVTVDTREDVTGAGFVAVVR